MSPATGRGERVQLDGKDLHIAIITARWNQPIITQLLSGVRSQLSLCGVQESNIVTEEVPGSFELPFAVQRLAKRKTYDAIIAIGVLIKGETMHFEYIAEAVTHGLMRVQLDEGVPVVFGVLTVLNEVQAWRRAGGGGGVHVGTGAAEEEEGAHNHGEDWGLAAVELGVRGREERERS